MSALTILVALISLNVLFVLMEYALVRSRPARIELLARKGDVRALRVQEMLSRLDLYFAAIQIGVTLVALALGAFAEPPITEILQEWTERLFGDLPDAPLRIVSLAIGLGLLAYLQIVLGELVPRAIAIHKAEAIVLWGSLPLKIFALLCRVPVAIMTVSSTALLRLLRLRPASEAEGVASEDEIRVLLGESQEKGVLPFERLILHENLFDLRKTAARHAMTPRGRVASLSLSRSWSENLETIRARRFSRYPLCRRGLDDVVGLVHVKDIVLQGGAAAPDLERIRRDIVSVPEHETTEWMLKTFPDKGIHMALVRDGKGAVSGLVTMEDLFEEMVGEVHDEFDLPQAWSLADVVLPSAVAVGLEAADAADAVRVLAQRLCAGEPSIRMEDALRDVVERERLLFSAVGRGIAVPHARLGGIRRAFVALGRFARPVPFAAAPDSVPIRLVFLVLTPSGSPVVQLRILARIAALASNESVRQRLLRAGSAAALLEALRTADTLLAG
jgi:CBS domain containing-hemolysin-like protein/mannitol/fructose-specific phosphotransferase system IIA component